MRRRFHCQAVTRKAEQVLEFGEYHGSVPRGPAGCPAVLLCRLAYRTCQIIAPPQMKATTLAAAREVHKNGFCTDWYWEVLLGGTVALRVVLKKEAVR